MLKHYNGGRTHLKTFRVVNTKRYRKTLGKFSYILLLI